MRVLNVHLAHLNKLPCLHAAVNQTTQPTIAPTIPTIPPIHVMHPTWVDPTCNCYPDLQILIKSLILTVSLANLPAECSPFRIPSKKNLLNCLILQRSATSFVHGWTATTTRHWWVWWVWWLAAAGWVRLRSMENGLVSKWTKYVQSLQSARFSRYSAHIYQLKICICMKFISSSFIISHLIQNCI